MFESGMPSYSGPWHSDVLKIGNSIKVNGEMVKIVSEAPRSGDYWVEDSKGQRTKMSPNDLKYWYDKNEAGK